MAAVQGDAPVPLPHLIAVLVGVALPQVGSSVRARRAHAGDAREPLGWRILLPVALTATALGTLFGSTEVVTVAFTEQLGRQVLAGPLLATWALGSLLAGVTTGSVPWRASPTRRRRGGGGARPGVAATEGISWSTTGLTAGIAPGAAVAGRLVDRDGTSAGFTVPLAAGVVAVTVALFVRSAESGHP